MQKLFGIFRAEAEKKKLPILLGELGAFNINAAKQFKQINQIIGQYASTDKNTAVIATSDLNHKGDNLHFNAAGQREMGKRYAAAMLTYILH
jgi:lysophospholipase L1-like esterase